MYLTLDTKNKTVFLYSCTKSYSTIKTQHCSLPHNSFLLSLIYIVIFARYYTVAMPIVILKEDLCVFCRRRSAIWRRCSITPCTVATTEAEAWGWDLCDLVRWKKGTTRHRTAACLTCRHRHLILGEEQTRTPLCIRAPTRLANQPPPYLIDEVAMRVGFIPFFSFLFIYHRFQTCFDQYILDDP